MEKKVIVLGGLGVSERRDRDADRVLNVRGGCYTLPAHMKHDRVLVVRRYGKKEIADDRHS